MKQVREHREDLLQRLPRLRLLFLIAVLIVTGRFWFVQAVQGDYYRELAENNRMRQLPLKAPRGLIYERDGQLLVENMPAYDLLLDPERSAVVQSSLQFAGLTLGKPVVELEQAYERQRTRAPFQPVLVAEGLSLSQVARFAVSALEHPEFEIDVRQLRLYRFGPMTAHVLGYLGEVTDEDLKRSGGRLKAGDLIGKKGIEKAFDEHLRGADGERVVIVDSHGRLRQEHRRQSAMVGKKLDLTLDLDLHQEAMRYFGELSGAVVAMEPKSGEVRLLLSSPAYNPNLFSRRLDQAAWQELLEAPHNPLQNRALQNTYSPGSVFKIVLAIGGLTERVVGPDNAVYCSGGATFYNRRFRCWRRGGHGWMNLHSAIKQSCDVYFYHLGRELGISRIAHYAQMFGLGRSTGIDIGNEKEGLVPNPQWSLEYRGTPWFPGETISVSIGQGPILATPLQIATMMAIVANGGYRVTPHLVASEQPASLERTELEPEALQRVREALWSVVNDQGTGAVARVRGIDVSGKTGTVQVVRQETWIESKDLPYEQRDHAWFASYATAGEEQLVVVVFVEHGGRGSQAAAPLAKRLYEVYFRDYLDSHQSS